MLQKVAIAIESWPEWDLNPRPLNPVQTLKPTARTQSQLCAAAPISSFVTHTHARMHAFIHTYIYSTHTHTRTHTYMHAYTQIYIERDRQREGERVKFHADTDTAAIFSQNNKNKTKIYNTMVSSA